MKKIKDNIKYIKLNDLLAPFIFLLILPCVLIFRLNNKLKHKKIWIVCENGETARDNGYWFYKYIKENKKDISCYSVIKKIAKIIKRLKI